MFSAAAPATARTNIQLRMLLTSLHLRSHETYFVDTGAMRDIDRFGYPLILQSRIALHEDHTFSARLEDFFQAPAHIGFVGVLTVDLVVVVCINDDDHGALIA